MSNRFIDDQWEKLCRDMEGRADRAAEAASEPQSVRDSLQQFLHSKPERYADLLDRFREASHLAQSWGVGSGDTERQPPGEPARQQAHEELSEEELIDEAVDESFPASDPPSWNVSHA